MKRLLARHSQVLNEMARSLLAIVLREIHLLEELFSIHAAEHGVLYQVLGVLKASDRIEASGSRCAHQMAVMFKFEHGIGDRKTFERVYNIPALHIPIECKMRLHDLSESGDCSIPASESSVIFAPRSISSFLPGHRPFIHGDPDRNKNCPDASYCLSPSWPNLPSLLVYVDTDRVESKDIRHSHAHQYCSSKRRNNPPVDRPHLISLELNRAIVCGGHG